MEHFFDTNFINITTEIYTCLPVDLEASYFKEKLFEIVIVVDEHTLKSAYVFFCS